MDRKLDAVTFDAGDTLLYCDPSPAEIYAEALSRHGRPVEPDEVGPAFRGAWAAMQRRTTAGADRYGGDERAFWGEILRDVLDRLDHGAPWQHLLDELYAAFARTEVWQLYDDSLPTLEALRGRGVRLAVVSNWDRRLGEILHGLGIEPYFDTVVVSAVEGVEKPDGRIFRTALGRLGVPAAAALHVGDSPREDYEGARAAGLDAALVDRERVFHGSGYRTIPTLCALLELV